MYLSNITFLNGQPRANSTRRSTKPPPGKRAPEGLGRLRVLQRVERLGDQAAGGVEPALRPGVIAGLGARLDLGKQVAERLRAELAAGSFERMGDAHRAGGIPACDAAGEGGGEPRQQAFELENEA